MNSKALIIKTVSGSTSFQMDLDASYANIGGPRLFFSIAEHLTSLSQERNENTDFLYMILLIKEVSLCAKLTLYLCVVRVSIH